MKVAVTGATGFIGRPLTEALLSDGHTVVAVTRDKKKAASLLPPAVTLAQRDSGEAGEWRDDVAGCEAVVNLAGENASSGRWTAKKKEELLESRIRSIRSIAEVCDGTAVRTIIQASAIGFYGPRSDEVLTEESARGTGFLSEIAERCENEAARLAGSNLRVVSIRTGIVLGNEGGIVPRLLTPVRLGFGGYPGNGRQWLSWIHIQDEVDAIRHLLENADLSGPFNLTAPEPVQMRDFVRLAGSVLHRPVWVPLPAFMLRAAFGEMADEALLTGQRVSPTRLTDAGFRFHFPTAASALESLLS